MNEFLNALGISLVAHLGWLSFEMALLAVGIGALLHVLRVESASVRYAFWSLVFIKPCASLFLTVPVLGSGLQIRQPVTDEFGRGFVSVVADAVGPVSMLDYYGVIGGIWALFFFVLAVRLIVGCVLVQFLCQQARVLSAGVAYNAVLKGCHTLGIRRRVGVRISALVQGPMVCGVWFPTILLPKDMVHTLSVTQIEYVVLHELAHVRRMDNLFLLLERIVETVFFFHPVVWFCGHVMRREAECACDDWVIRSGGCRVMYADCMVRVAEISGGGHTRLLAYPFLMRPSLFAQRIQRLSVKNFTRSSYFSGKRALLVMPALVVIGLPRITVPHITESTPVETIVRERDVVVPVHQGSVWGKTKLVGVKTKAVVEVDKQWRSPNFKQTHQNNMRLPSIASDVLGAKPRLYEFVNASQFRSSLEEDYGKRAEKKKPIYAVDLKLVTLRQLGHYIDREEDKKDMPFFWVAR